MASKIALIVLALLFCFDYSEAETVPAIFLFGDSLLDVGNNKYLGVTIGRADFPPNGVDYQDHKATGRFSNGKNLADFIAERVGLRSPPPYLSLGLKKDKKTLMKKGVNFASAGAGILNQTIFYGPQLGQLISLTKQVDHYINVHQDLVKELGSPSAQQNYLSKSIFCLVIGTTDLANYLTFPNFKMKYTDQVFVKLMSSSLARELKRIYRFGARKFMVSGLGQLECMPAIRLNSPNQEDCYQARSLSLLNYNQELKMMLKVLKSELQDFSCIYLDSYGAMQLIFQQPENYGFTEIKMACCGLGKLNAETPCLPGFSCCSNRKERFFWDQYHLSEAAAHTLVDIILDDASPFVFPASVTQLMRM